jgi:Dolichyl-phosphate-mannose-protein mannosyltransferase
MEASRPAPPTPAPATATGARAALSAQRARLWWAVALAAYALALVLVSGRASLWGDEGFTAATVRLPWSVMLSDLRHIDVNMGLYYMLEWLVTGLAGTGETGLRLLSIGSVVAAVPLVARSARALAGESGRGPGAGFAAMAFAANPFVLYLALTARPYALLVLGQVLTSLLLLRAIRDGGRRAWLWWTAAAVAICYVHLIGILVVAAEWGYAVFDRRVALQHKVMTAVLLAFGAIPTVAFLAPGDTLSWVPPATPAGAVAVVTGVLGGKVFENRTARLALWFLGVVTGTVLVVLPLQSLLISLYLCPVLVPLAWLAGRGLGLVRPLPARAVIAAVLAVATLAGVGVRLNRLLAGPQDWRGASAAMASRVAPGDAVAFPDPFYRIVAEYYAGGGADWQRAEPVLPARPWGSLRPYELDRIERLQLQSDPATIAQQVASRPSVWLAGVPESQLDRGQQVLQSLGFRLVDTVDLAGVTLRHLVR